MGTEYLTPAQAATYLQVHQGTLRRAVLRGTLDAVKLGRAVRYRRSDLDNLGRNTAAA